MDGIPFKFLFLFGLQVITVQACVSAFIPKTKVSIRQEFLVRCRQEFPCSSTDGNGSETLSLYQKGTGDTDYRRIVMFRGEEFIMDPSVNSHFNAKNTWYLSGTKWTISFEVQVESAKCRDSGSYICGIYDPSDPSGSTNSTPAYLEVWGDHTSLTLGYLPQPLNPYPDFMHHLQYELGQRVILNCTAQGPQGSWIVWQRWVVNKTKLGFIETPLPRFPLEPSVKPEPNALGCFQNIYVSILAFKLIPRSESLYKCYFKNSDMRIDSQFYTVNAGHGIRPSQAQLQVVVTITSFFSFFLGMYPLETRL